MRKIKEKNNFQEIIKRYNDFITKENKNLFRIPTCSFNINKLLDGGIPSKIIMEIFGHEGSGKSSLILSTISQLAKDNRFSNYKFCYIDTEGGLCGDFMSRYSLDSENIIIFNLSHGEKIFDLIDELIEDGNCLIIALDSIATIISNEDLDSENSLGSHARMISKRLRKTVSLLNQSNCNTSLILVNQMRSKIGMVDSWKGEFQLTTTGGKSIKYYSSIRAEVERSQFILHKEKKVGFVANFKVHKSRFSFPYSSCQFPILFKNAVSNIMEYINILFDEEILLKPSSSGYIVWNNIESIFDIKVRTKYELLEYIENNEDIKNKFFNFIKNKLVI